MPHPLPYFLFSDLATWVTYLKMTSDMTVSKRNKGYTDLEIHRFFILNAIKEQKTHLNRYLIGIYYESMIKKQKPQNICKKVTVFFFSQSHFRLKMAVRC